MMSEAGVFVLMILIPSVARETQTNKFVFTSNRDTEVGIHSPPYLFLLGLLMSQYSISGFDASAHMVFISVELNRLRVPRARGF